MDLSSLFASPASLTPQNYGGLLSLFGGGQDNSQAAQAMKLLGSGQPTQLPQAQEPLPIQSEMLRAQMAGSGGQRGQTPFPQMAPPVQAQIPTFQQLVQRQLGMQQPQQQMGGMLGQTSLGQM